MSRVTEYSNFDPSRERQHILVVFCALHGGGCTYAHDMAEGFAENGHDVTCVISSKMENFAEWKRIKDAHIIPIDGYSSKWDFLFKTLCIRRITRPIKKALSGAVFDFQYIPIATYWTLPLWRIGSAKKTVYTMHDPIPHKKLRPMSLINDICGRKADRIVVLSESFAEYVAKKYKKSGRVIASRLGVQRYYDKVASQEAPKDLFYRPNYVNFLFHGRIDKYKGLDVLLRSYSQLSKELNYVSLTIAGSGDLSEYRDAIRTLRNVNVVNRWIEDSEIKWIFTGNNVVTVLPYTTATQSGVSTVAMYYESLIIATNSGGLPEQVKDGERGFLVEPNDSEALYKTMRYVANHIDKLHPLIQNAKAYIDDLNWKVISQQLIEGVGNDYHTNAF